MGSITIIACNTENFNFSNLLSLITFLDSWLDTSEFRDFRALILSAYVKWRCNKKENEGGNEKHKCRTIHRQGLSHEHLRLARCRCMRRTMAGGRTILNTKLTCKYNFLVTDQLYRVGRGFFHFWPLKKVTFYLASPSKKISDDGPAY